jgi:hypothetical protein
VLFEYFKLQLVKFSLGYSYFLLVGLLFEPIFLKPLAEFFPNIADLHLS